jgi:hypothetical protein
VGANSTPKDGKSITHSRITNTPTKASVQSGGVVLRFRSLGAFRNIRPQCRIIGVSGIAPDLWGLSDIVIGRFCLGARPHSHKLLTERVPFTPHTNRSPKSPVPTPDTHNYIIPNPPIMRRSLANKICLTCTADVRHTLGFIGGNYSHVSIKLSLWSLQPRNVNKIIVIVIIVISKYLLLGITCICYYLWRFYKP